MPINKGEAYILRGVEPPNYAMVVEDAKEGYIITFDTGSVDPKNLHPIPFPGTEAQFLERYQLATQEQVEGLLTRLRENLGATAQKINLLEQSAQRQPSCMDDETFDFHLFPYEGEEAREHLRQPSPEDVAHVIEAIEEPEKPRRGRRCYDDWTM
ncbi:MAG: hypothetical protein PHH00_00115 [Candidatus Nanoarchaeia archaeon]|nr:hypothetical protein [Candidatus Nanoarchaeia archaeon]